MYLFLGWPTLILGLSLFVKWTILKFQFHSRCDIIIESFFKQDRSVLWIHNGAQKLLDRINRFRDTYGEHFEPAPMLQDFAKDPGKRFHAK